MPRKLIHPISNEEVTKSISKLNKNRSAGYDTITAELIKHGPEILQSIIKTILNNCFEQHKQIDIAKGILVALQKPDELIYADDADFLTTDLQRDIKLNRIVKNVLLEDNLKVNETKTEHTTIERTDKNDEKWRTVKMLGSLL